MEGKRYIHRHTEEEVVLVGGVGEGVEEARGVYTHTHTHTQVERRVWGCRR
jgi:hypothetical protein